ncbi:MAG: hypothetical protein WB014_07740 [Methanosarcina sp.]
MIQELFSDRKTCKIGFGLFILSLTILAIVIGIDNVIDADKVINATVELGDAIFGYIGSYMQLK